MKKKNRHLLIFTVFTLFILLGVNNSALADDIKITNGTASASSTTAPNYADNAFDAYPNTYWMSEAFDSERMEWLQYQLPLPKIVTKYRITSDAINSWTLRGSNDGTNWTTLHSGNGSMLGQEILLINNITPYIFYRIEAMSVLECYDIEVPTTGEIITICPYYQVIINELELYTGLIDPCNPSGELEGVYECGGVMETVGTTEVDTCATLIANEVILNPGFHAKQGSNLIINDGPVPPPTTADINVSANNILKCDTITLSWSSSNASYVSISPGIGEVDPNGNMTVYPGTTKTYTITAINEYGCSTATDSVTVTVKNIDLLSGSGTATASSSSGSYTASKAFDSRIDTSWQAAASSPTTHWLKYAMDEAKIVTSYAILSRGNTICKTPKDWKLQGSNDGNNWTTLHTVTGFTAWAANDIKGYYEVDIDNIESFKFYRLYVTEVNACCLNNNCDYSIKIRELELRAHPCNLDTQWLMEHCGTIDYCSNDDPDDDGLTMIQEYENGTHPCKYDSDNDGLDDGLEISIGTDPLNWDSDGELLPDGSYLSGDLLSDSFEYYAGLNPLSKDSDGDGIEDTLDDLDGDGLNNLDELIHGTDPTESDSDTDGINDRDEVEQGSDPNDESDEGIPPEPDAIVELLLQVGDHSESNSERYVLNVGDISHQSPKFGEVEPGTYKFKRGEEYIVTLEHLGTDPQYYEDANCDEHPENCPDLDYTALIEPAGSSDACVIIVDPYPDGDPIFDNLLLRVYGEWTPGAGGTPDTFSGKTAKVILPQVVAITLDDDPIIPGESTTAHADIKPSGRTATWSIEDLDDGVHAEIDEDSGVITVSPDSKSGDITIRAADADAPDCYYEAVVSVGCSSCSSGVCMSPGFSEPELSSIDIDFGLGRSHKGKLAGKLYIKSDQPSPYLSTPESLRFSSLATDVEVMREQDLTLSQILAPETLVDIVVIDDFTYDIDFYDPLDITGRSGRFYIIAQNTEPIVSWRVENPDRSTSIYNRLKLTETRGGAVKEYEYIWDSVNSEWSLSKAGGLVVETLETEVISGDTVRTRTLKDEFGTVVSVTQTTYRDYAWGREIVAEVADPDGDALTTNYTYYDTIGTNGYGKLKNVTNPDGSWTRYGYNADGKIIREITPWLDSPVGSSESSSRVIYNDYTPVHASDTEDDLYEFSPRTVTEKIQGTTVAKTYYVYIINPSTRERTEITENCVDSSASYGNSANLRTETVYYKSNTDLAESGKIKSILHLDGQLETYSYTYGSYSPNGNPALPGVFTPGSGMDIRSIVVHGTSSSPQGIAYKTSRNISIQNYLGRELLSETQVYKGSAYERVQYSTKLYDAAGHVTDTYMSDGKHTSAEWDCCHKTSETNAQGITYEYIDYDALGRLETSEKIGMSPYPDILTSYTYDAAGRTLTTTITGGSLSLMTENYYYVSGRPDYSVDQAGLMTTYTYSANNRINTVIRPGGATEITEIYRDGKIKSVTGTGVVNKYYTYGVNTDGTQWTKVNTGSASSTMYEKTTTDILGRTISIEKPGYTGTEITEYYYDDYGRLYITVTPGQADIIYDYDELGNQVRSGLDVDGNGVLTPASVDRITDTDSYFAFIDSNWWQETIQQIYPIDNNGTAKTVSTQRSRLTGLGTSGVVSESVSIDLHGNITTSEVSIDRANSTVTQTVDYPDSTIDEVSINENGLLVSSTNKSGILITFEYDDLGRRTHVTDPRTGTSETHYNGIGQVDWVEDAANNRTSFTYDPDTGEKVAEENALSKVTRYAYDDLGQLTNTWGDTTYPVKYVYDTYGRMKQMHTFRGGSGWSGVNWPAGSTGDADVTTWDYQESTGLLRWKQDAEGERVTYTYETGGKLETRTWARNSGTLVTTYIYDPDTGELTDIEYSDTTPNVGFTYDRLGRQATVTDAVGSRIFTYNPATLQLETETITGLYNKVITRAYDTTNVKGRNTGFYIGSGYIVSYGYEPNTGRFKSVSWNVNGVTDNAAYSYLPNSDLLYTMTTNSGLTTTYSYEPNRNLMTGVQNNYGAGLISKYDYQYDETGRRSSVQNSGQAFTDAAFNIFGYNDRNELNESNRYIGPNIEDTSYPVTEEYRYYNYDSIGNRSSSIDWDPIAAAQAQVTYTPDPLNQYSQISADIGTTFNNVPVYDEDGNMTSASLGGSAKTLTYNAENQLIAVEPQSPVTGDKRIEMLYDFMGRRVEKKVYTYSSSTWSLTADNLFVYDNWNMIQELNGSGTVQKSYVYGLDLSQSLQGAGGVGGLISSIQNQTSSSQIFYYDANGNVGQLIDSANGSIVAHYEYDPFGNEINVFGSMADANIFRFSTKYYDTETDLYYYGYRYYSTSLGRWINRDPEEEEGGFNMYVFSNNDGINSFDILGLWKATSVSAGKKRRVYLWEKGDTKASLAKKVKLNLAEFDKWAKANQSAMAPDGKTHCEYSVPNIWIAADVGGKWTLNPLSMHFYAKIGMVMGRFIGTDIATSNDYHKIKINSAQNLYKNVQQNVSDIWGISVFGHGGKDGYLGDFRGTDYINQSKLIIEFEKQKYKLAKAYLFQCYSGYKGTYQGKHYDWTKEWNKVANDPLLYTGQDWLIDMPF